VARGDDVRLRSLVWLALTLLSSPVSAQGSLADPSTVRRPRLAADADTNSWMAYYNFGIEHLRDSPGKAEDAFVWATRIDPSRAEPLIGRWVAHWNRNLRLFIRYQLHREALSASPHVIQTESLKVRALLRNPFVRHDAEVVLYERLVGGPWSWDRVGRALLAYGDGRYDEAARLFAAVASNDSVESAWANYYVALCFVATHEYDRAADQITALVGETRRRASLHISYRYQSQELLQYGLGILRLTVGDTAAARANLGEALTENLAFYPAHALLGDIALATGDSTQAVAEYALALELQSDDGVLHYRYARLLGDVGRLPDAERELRRAIALEPLYAPPYLGLALVLDTRGDRAGALEQYRRYLERTPRNDPRIATARQRIQALSQ
jgi:tetratricopeptide (TPR) repeat protein